MELIGGNFTDHNNYKPSKHKKQKHNPENINRCIHTEVS